MIQLIVGNKGSGKTKRLIDMANQAASTSAGNVVCVEKGLVLTFNVGHKVRLVNTEDYGIEGFETLYGFLCGLMAGNYDITDIFVDATFKIGGRDTAALAKLIDRLSKPTKDNNTNLTFTISCDSADLPEALKEYIA